MAAGRAELLERFRKAAERGERLRAVACRWEGKVMYRRKCCDYVECHCAEAGGAGVLVVKKTDCRVCLRREPVVSAEGGDRQG